jgi:hypothetical protein
MSSWLTRNPGGLSNRGVYVAPALYGGLGNRIFQILAAQKYAELTGRTFVLLKEEIYTNPHETEEKTLEQLQEIFGQLPFYTGPATSWTKVTEEKWQWYKYEFNTLPRNTGKNVILNGYWQGEKYFPKRMPSLNVPSIPLPYTFLHLRFGDFKGTIHDLDMIHYYRKAILASIYDHPDQPFLVFSDDMEKAREFLEPYGIEYAESSAKNALDVLKGMAACRGGICANSSLSYLGACFQKRGFGSVFMPQIWVKGIDKLQMTGYFPIWAKVVDLKDDRPKDSQM